MGIDPLMSTGLFLLTLKKNIAGNQNQLTIFRPRGVVSRRASAHVNRASRISYPFQSRANWPLHVGPGAEVPLKVTTSRWGARPFLDGHVV